MLQTSRNEKFTFEQSAAGQTLRTQRASFKYGTRRALHAIRKTVAETLPPNACPNERSFFFGGGSHAPVSLAPLLVGGGPSLRLARDRVCWLGLTAGRSVERQSAASCHAIARNPRVVNSAPQDRQNRQSKPCALLLGGELWAGGLAGRWPTCTCCRPHGSRNCCSGTSGTASRRA